LAIKLIGKSCIFQPVSSSTLQFKGRGRYSIFTCSFYNHF
jgi:hypothetical protein